MCVFVVGLGWAGQQRVHAAGQRWQQAASLADSWRRHAALPASGCVAGGRPAAAGGRRQQPGQALVAGHLARAPHPLHHLVVQLGAGPKGRHKEQQAAGGGSRREASRARSARKGAGSGVNAISHLPLPL